MINNKDDFDPLIPEVKSPFHFDFSATGINLWVESGDLCEAMSWYGRRYQILRFPFSESTFRTALGILADDGFLKRHYGVKG